MKESSHQDDLEYKPSSSYYRISMKGISKKSFDRNMEKGDEANPEKTIEWFETKKSVSYYWNDVENRKYIKFLKESGYLLKLPPRERKIKKVNLSMSKKVKTRNSTQCHTHHQKMMAKYGSIEGIICHYQFLFDSKRKASIQEPIELIHEEQLMENLIPLTELQVAVEAIATSLSEPQIIDVASILLHEQLFDKYYQINEKELMEWIDW